MGNQQHGVVCIANTHIVSNIEFPDVKLWQAQVLNRELEKISSNYHQGIPVVLAGDFNSEPSSAVYSLFSEGVADYENHVDCRRDTLDILNDGKVESFSKQPKYDGNLSYNQEYFHDPNTGMYYPNPGRSHMNTKRHLAFESAYHKVLGKEPSFTNYTGHYAGVLDYIWHGNDHLRVLRVLQQPSEEEIKDSNTALPNAVYPSDHLPL